MGFFGNLFSKQTCGICGKEVGALSRTKLGDGNYVCHACKKEMSGYYDLHRHDLEDVKKHLKYMEKSNELYEKEFATLGKEAIDYCGHHGSYKIGFADSIGMFEIISPLTKKSNKKELFRYDQIEGFGSYEVLNSANRQEGEKKYKEYGVLIKMRCAENYANLDASAAEKAKMHPYVIELKIPIQHNVDVPSGGDRIFAHLNSIFGSKASPVASAAASVASVFLGSPAASIIPTTNFSDANRAEYAKLADKVETRALGKTLRELTK